MAIAFAQEGDIGGGLVGDKIGLHDKWRRVGIVFVSVLPLKTVSGGIPRERCPLFVQKESPHGDDSVQPPFGVILTKGKGREP